MAQVWDSSHNSSYSFSADALTATHTRTGNVDPGFASIGAIAGRYYWETILTGGGVGTHNVGTGIGNIFTTVATYLGSTSDGLVNLDNGIVLTNGANVATWGAFSAGNIICHALDLINNKYWQRIGISGNWNNDAAGDPTNPTSSGNLSIPAAITAQAVVPGYMTVNTGDQVVGAFLRASWAGVPPAGFGPITAPELSAVALGPWAEVSVNR